MALNLRSLSLFNCSPTGVTNKGVAFYTYATPDAVATLLAAGYFNDAREKLVVNDVIFAVAVASGVAELITLVVRTVPSSGDVTVQTDTDEAAGAARAVVATSGGLTTGLLAADDTFVSVTSADANHIVTAPPIADVALGKEIWGKNGGTAFEMRTPATSNTKINQTDADNTEAVVAANATFMLKKVAADEWTLLTIVAGAVVAPAVD